MYSPASYRGHAMPEACAAAAIATMLGGYAIAAMRGGYAWQR